MKCPYCAEIIQDEAIKCKHCGEWLKKEECVKKEVSPPNSIETPPQDQHPPTGKLPYSPAGVMKRVIAFFIDAILLFIPAIVIVLSGADEGYMIIYYVGIFIYFTLMESDYKQATLGKIVLGLAVTDLNGNRISFLKATGRFLIKFGSIFLVIIFIGFVGGFLKKGYVNRTPTCREDP